MSGAPQVTSHSWERRERASEGKGGGLTVTPAASGTCLPPGNSSGMNKQTSHKATFKCFLSPSLYIRVTHDLGEVKHLALRNHLKPQSQGEDEKVSGGDGRELKQPQEQ